MPASSKLAGRLRSSLLATERSASAALSRLSATHGCVSSIFAVRHASDYPSRQRSDFRNSERGHGGYQRARRPDGFGNDRFSRGRSDNDSTGAPRYDRFRSNDNGPSRRGTRGEFGGMRDSRGQRSFDRYSDQRSAIRGETVEEDVEEVPYADPDAELEVDESDIAAATEKLEASVKFETIKSLISPNTYRAIVDTPMKLTNMSPVQAEVMSLMPNLASPPAPLEKDQEILDGRKDLLFQAKTGTGKTLAFLIPAIEQRIRTLDAVGKQAAIDAGQPDDQVLMSRARRAYARSRIGTLIISPTRELATQIANEAIRASSHHREFEVRLFVGGVNKGMQMRDFMQGHRDIVVATTGRLLDLIQSEPELKEAIKSTSLLVLDEADTLLDMGFREDIEMLKRFLPEAPHRQTFLCSATMSSAIQQVSRSYLRPDHKFIRTVTSESPVHAHVQQYHTILPSAADQIPHLVRLIAHDQMVNAGKSKIVLFMPTTKQTQLFSTLLRELARSNLPARRTNIYELHSKKSQDSRTSTSNKFRNDVSGASVLVTSDVSARGVDYPRVTRVIQVGTPSSTETYIHRVGRTGRAGTEGRGDIILLPWEQGFVTWQLTSVPLKPLTTNELAKEVHELADNFEQDPSKFVDERVRPSLKNKKIKMNERSWMEPATFPPGVPDRVKSVDATMKALQERLDPQAINETFVAMLGYYVARFSELRVEKPVILEGCKEWAMQAVGMTEPPYVSPMFLEKIGFGGRGGSRGGSSRRPQQFLRDRGDRGDNQFSWNSRGGGSQRSAQRGGDRW